MLCSAAVPRLVNDGSAALANGPSATVARAIAGPPTRNCSNTGVAWSEKSASLAIVERSCRSASGKRWKPASRSGLRSAVASAATLALLMNPETACALAGERLHDPVAVAGELAELLVLAGQLGQHPVGLAERRVGAPDDRRQVLAPSGEPGPQVVEDQPEAIGVGLAHDVVDQVDVHCLAVVLQRQEVLAGSGLAIWNLVQRRRQRRARRPRQGGLAVDVFLPQKRLGTDQAGGVLAKVLEASLVDLHHDHRLAGIRRPVPVHALAGQRHFDGRHGADVAPATRTSSPGTRKPPLSKIARTSYSSPSPLAAWPNRASSPWPGARLWLRSSSWPRGNVGGVALRVRALAAGQQVAVVREGVGAGDRRGRAARAAGEVVELEAVELLAGRDGRQLPGGVGPARAGAGGVGVARLAVVEQVRLRGGDARVVARGVVVGRDLRELGQEAHEVGHVGAGELDHGLGGV